MTPAWNEYGTLKLVGVRSAGNAFKNQARIDAQWQKLRFHAPPDLGKARSEHQNFRRKLQLKGAELIELGCESELTLDSIYTRDNIIVGPDGLILCNMGRTSRTSEGPINAAAYTKHGVKIAGSIQAPGTLEGGDFIWIDKNTAAVALGPRTNETGIAQLNALLGDDVELHIVPLPMPDHPDDVLHLMSIISPVDRDLAVIYPPMVPPGFLDWLTGKGIRFVEVPEDEFLPMGCNVLALAPRCVLMLENLPQTRARLVSAGCEIHTYSGLEISRKGEGGPTCLTRPLLRTL